MAEYLCNTRLVSWALEKRRKARVSFNLHDSAGEVSRDPTWIARHYQWLSTKAWEAIRGRPRLCYAYAGHDCHRQKGFREPRDYGGHFRDERFPSMCDVRVIPREATEDAKSPEKHLSFVPCPTEG